MNIQEREASDKVLKIEDVCKSYVKGTLVNDHISLTLNRGKFLDYLGLTGQAKPLW